jgi:hypothetical protein
MSMRSITAVVITCILAGCAYGQSLQEWRKLIPLESTRKDVDRILGKPKILDVNRSLFTAGTSKVIAEFSTGKCDTSSKRIQWNVEPGRLVNLMALESLSKPLSSYVDNLLSFKRSEDNVDDGVGYSYTSAGGSVVVQSVLKPGIGEVVTVIYLLPRKDQENLKCKFEPTTK